MNKIQQAVAFLGVELVILGISYDNDFTLALGAVFLLLTMMRLLSRLSSD